MAGELAEFLESKGMNHVRGAPYHPQMQGKIERWHQTLKNRVLLNNYYLPTHLEHEIGQFIEYYNHERYHESIDNLTSADVYFGRGNSILEKRRSQNFLIIFDLYVSNHLTTDSHRLLQQCDVRHL